MHTRDTHQSLMRSNQNSYSCNEWQRTRDLHSREWRNYLQNLLALPLLWKYPTPPPTLVTLSTIPINKSGLGIQNPLISAHKIFEILQCTSVELMNVVTRKSEFSSANHVRAVREYNTQRETHNKGNNIKL